MTKTKTIIFYILSFTWGIVMSLIGSLVLLVLIIAGKKPQKFHDRIYIEIGKGWGGVELGPFFLCSENSSYSLMQHESGHGFQNALLGPLMPFLVCIPSAARYWLWEFDNFEDKNKYSVTVSVAFLLISMGFLIPGVIVNNVGIIITGSLLTFYTLCFAAWLIAVETPKYAQRPYPKYDDIWFEGCATRWGAKVYPANN